MTCETCHLDLQKVPGESYHFSDHEGVAATLTIKRNITGQKIKTVEKHSFSEGTTFKSYEKSSCAANDSITILLV